MQAYVSTRNYMLAHSCKCQRAIPYASMRQQLLAYVRANRLSKYIDCDAPGDVNIQPLTHPLIHLLTYLLAYIIAYLLPY